MEIEKRGEVKIKILAICVKSIVIGAATESVRNPFLR